MKESYQPLEKIDHHAMYKLLVNLATEMEFKIVPGSLLTDSQFLLNDYIITAKEILKGGTIREDFSISKMSRRSFK